jgi:hypothetical protein
VEQECIADGQQQALEGASSLVHQQKIDGRGIVPLEHRIACDSKANPQQSDTGLKRCVFRCLWQAHSQEACDNDNAQNDRM